MNGMEHIEHAYSKKLLQKLSFVAMDLETTGGVHESDQIIEIGLVKIENLKISRELDYLVNPKSDIPKYVQRLTSISPETLKDSPTIEKIIHEILDFIGDSIIVAHNISFDLPFFNSVLKRLNLPLLTNRSLCTQLMGQYLIPNMLSSNLGYMGRLFNIPHKKAHRALEDAKVCAHLLLNFLHIFIKKGIRKVNQLYYPQSKFELNRAHFSKDEASQCLGVLGEIHSATIVYLKGEKGLELASIPLKDPSQEIEIVSSVMAQVPWKTITVELMGHFFEAFLHYNLNYNKFESRVKELINLHLHGKHLKGKDKDKDKERALEPTSEKYHIGPGSESFLISHHLIPGQLTIYPLFHLGHNNALIFHFPAHKKRLLYYAQGCIKRNDRRRRKKSSQDFGVHRDLFPFIERYLVEETASRKKDLLIVHKNTFTKNQMKLFKSIKTFLKTAPKDNTYPLEHL
ncbi:MAG: 3'-5' exonuclease [Bacteriovoracales bacterium]|nr:3'-5' exonuclease [Bacteriovoracales bacterium]